MDSFTLYHIAPDKTATEIELEASALRDRIASHRARHMATEGSFLQDCFALSALICFVLGVPFLLFALRMALF